MLVQVATSFLVGINVAVHGFVADPQAAFQSKAMFNLFRTEVRSDQPLDFSPFMHSLDRAEPPRSEVVPEIRTGP